MSSIASIRPLLWSGRYRLLGPTFYGNYLDLSVIHHHNSHTVQYHISHNWADNVSSKTWRADHFSTRPTTSQNWKWLSSQESLPQTGAQLPPLGSPIQLLTIKGHCYSDVCLLCASQVGSCSTYQEHGVSAQLDSRLLYKWIVSSEKSNIQLSFLDCEKVHYRFQWASLLPEESEPSLLLLCLHFHKIFLSLEPVDMSLASGVGGRGHLTRFFWKLIACCSPARQPWGSFTLAMPWGTVTKFVSSHVDRPYLSIQLLLRIEVPLHVFPREVDPGFYSMKKKRAYKWQENNHWCHDAELHSWLS